MASDAFLLHLHFDTSTYKYVFVMIRKQSKCAMNHCRFYRVEFSTPWFVIKSATVLPFRVVISLLLDGHKHHLEYPWINCMVADPSNRFQDRSLLEDHHTQKLVTAITLALRDLRGGLPVVKSSFYTHLTVEYNNIYLSIYPIPIPILF